MHRELELLVHAGLTPIEALTAATSAPAKYFRLTDRGRIAPGLRADLLLVSGDPVANILATREVVSVWKRGVRMDRDAYRIWVSQQRASTTEAPREAQDGLVSDFEQDQPMARLGSGWVVTTDQFIGGKSVGTIRVAPDGAAGSAKSLLVEGTVNAGSIVTWSGAMLLTGKTPMQPADFSARKTLRFWARGDGKTYSVMLFSQRHGPQPMTRTFTAGAEWKEFVFALADFDGFDGKDLQGLAFTSASAPGSFEFRLDDVRLK